MDHARFRPELGVLLVAVLWALAGCGQGGGRPPAESGLRRPRALAVRVFSDTGRTERLTLGSSPPAARVWLARVARFPLAAAALPSPEAPPDTVLPEPSAPQRVADDALKPPLQRGTSDLRLPRGLGSGQRYVELDVCVDRAGRVADVRWAGGDPDTALVGAAVSCARAMTFYPALLRGEPVEVWCRQRFEFSR